MVAAGEQTNRGKAVSWLYIAMELVLLALSVRRIGILPVPTAFFAYLILGHLVLIGANLDLINYPFLFTWTTYAYQQFAEEVHLSLFVIFVLTFLATLGLRADANRAMLTVMPQGATVERLAYAILFLLWLRTLIVLPYLRWDYVMSNSSYLLLGGPGVLTSPGGLAGLMHSIGKISGLVCAVLFGFAIARRRFGMMVVTMPLFAWHFVYELASYSRYAFVYAVAVTIVVFFSTSGLRRVVSTGTAAFLALLSLVVALDGRGEGQYGLATLPSMLEFDNLVSTLRASIGNLFEGVFVLSEHFRATIDYDESYKLLSLSVLPSFLDGFSSIQVSGERRIHFYVPRGAIDEALQFGLLYVVIYAAVCMAAVRASIKLLLSRRQPIIAMVLNIVLLLGLQLQFTYSVRTIFRVFVAVWLLSWLLSKLRRPATRAAEDSPRAAPMHLGAR
ncbi:MAG: hypothetical protein SFU85_09930 [Candidatus Methylacidiphilales bacterium]|nr:hypothetical protein [Candidatus Methylacidiphilales bacterium]